MKIEFRRLVLGLGLRLVLWASSWCASLTHLVRFCYEWYASLTVGCAFLTVQCTFLTVRCAFWQNCRINVEWPGKTPIMLSLFGRVHHTGQVPLKASPLFFIGYLIVRFPYILVFYLGFFRGYIFFKI